MKSGKRTGFIILAVVVVIILAIAGTVLGSYNGLVASEETVKTAYSDIQTDLQRRNDLIPNLVATVKQYAAHEESIYTEIANARSAMMNAGNVNEAAEASTAVSSALGRLFAITESYPDLKANENFRDLQTQLEGTENRISVARTKYNEAAKEYNTNIRKFPKSIIAGMFGFEAFDYFEASAGAQDVPDVGNAFNS